MPLVEYPVIKCNIARDTHERIYTVKYDDARRGSYVLDVTASEAEKVAVRAAR